MTATASSGISSSTGISKQDLEPREVGVGKLGLVGLDGHRTMDQESRRGSTEEKKADWLRVCMQPHLPVACVLAFCCCCSLSLCGCGCGWFNARCHRDFGDTGIHQRGGSSFKRPGTSQVDVWDFRAGLRLRSASWGSQVLRQTPVVQPDQSPSAISPSTGLARAARTYRVDRRRTCALGFVGVS